MLKPLQLDTFSVISWDGTGVEMGRELRIVKYEAHVCFSGGKQDQLNAVTTGRQTFPSCSSRRWDDLVRSAFYLVPMSPYEHDVTRPWNNFPGLNSMVSTCPEHQANVRSIQWKYVHMWATVGG